MGNISGIYEGHYGNNEDIIVMSFIPSSGFLMSKIKQTTKNQSKSCRSESTHRSLVRSKSRKSVRKFKTQTESRLPHVQNFLISQSVSLSSWLWLFVAALASRVNVGDVSSIGDESGEKHKRLIEVFLSRDWKQHQKHSLC